MAHKAEHAVDLDTGAILAVTIQAADRGDTQTVDETGRMRRTHLRGSRNIRKRVLVHAAAANLGLLMRKLFGVGTPRALQSGKKALAAAVLAISRLLQAIRALRAATGVDMRAQRAITPRQSERLA